MKKFVIYAKGKLYTLELNVLLSRELYLKNTLN